MKWRVINQGEHSEAVNQALEEVMTQKVSDGEVKPTFRIWRRPHTSIPFGRFQSYQDEVQEDYVEDEGIEVVRRMTGGGAMFSEPGNVITYSIIIPEEDVNTDIRKSYEELDSFAVETLRELGVDVKYEPVNDIVHEKGKIGGAAQLRKSDTVLHHTMMSYDLNIEKMLKALRIGKEKVSDKAIKSAEQRVSRIKDHTDTSRKETIQKLIEKFTEDKEYTEEQVTSEELEEARELAKEKYSTPEWNKKI